MVVSNTLRPLCSLEKPGTHCVGGWKGLEADPDGTENAPPPPPEFNRRTDRITPSLSLSIRVCYIPFMAICSIKHNNYFTFPYVCLKQRQGVWLTGRVA
jgi:hypothetical protein